MQMDELTTHHFTGKFPHHVLLPDRQQWILPDISLPIDSLLKEQTTDFHPAVLLELQKHQSVCGMISCSKFFGKPGKLYQQELQNTKTICIKTAAFLLYWRYFAWAEVK